ncbi:MAG: type II secretion system protein [Desulfosporosinus sp.]
MKASGYTLIEILVVLTVIGILFGVGFVGYRDFGRRQALAGAVKMVQGDLRVAQQNALSGIKPTGAACNSPRTLSGYHFKVITDSKYQIQALCSGGSITINDVNMPPNIKISTPLPNPILFKILGMGTDISVGGASITLTQGSTGKTQTISIGSGGDINIK